MSLIDRSQMRHPFFEVLIGPPGAKVSEMVKLPAELRRLISSFEYTEAIDGGKGSAARIRLIFYDSDHKSASVLDRTLEQTGGTQTISYLDPEQVRNGKLLNKRIKAKKEEIAKTVIKSPDDKESIKLRNSRLKEVRELENKRKNVRFLIQERNTIQVIWGYKNHDGKIQKLSNRIARGEILQINHKASAGDIPLTEVLAVDIGSGEMSAIYPKKGINFDNETVNEHIKIGSPKGISIKRLDGTYLARKSTDPARIDDIFEAIAQSFLNNARTNIQLTKEELELDIQDSNSSRTWAQGTNLHSFLKNLAEKLYANYFITTELNDGKLRVVLNLISKRIFEENIKFHFAWKSNLNDAGIEHSKTSSLVFNTMKSFNLALYPGGGSGASSSGICSKDKKLVGHVSNVDIRFSAKLYEQREKLKLPQKLDDRNPDSAKNIDSTGVATYSAACNPEQHESTANRLAGRMERGIKITFVTIGIPQLTPRVVKVSNIGVRHSGLYSLLSVTHKISDADGYICNCVGESNVVASGGVDVESPPVRNDLAESYKIDWKAEPGEIRDNLKFREE